MKVKSLILKSIELHFGDGEPVYSHFEKRTEAEIKDLLVGCRSQEPIDMVLYLFFNSFKDDSCPVVVPLQNHFWAYFYCMVNNCEGFSKRYAAIGPTEDTFTIHGDVVFNLINNCKNIEFRTVSSFNALIALRMHWRALDLIKKHKRQANVAFDPALLASKSDFFNSVCSKEDRLMAESALDQLSKEDQVFFKDCLDLISYDDMVKKYLPVTTDIGKAKAVLRQRKTRLIQRLKKFAGIIEPEKSRSCAKVVKLPLLVLFVKGQKQAKVSANWAKINHPDKQIFLTEITSQQQCDDAIANMTNVTVVVLGQQSCEKDMFVPKMINVAYDIVLLFDGERWRPSHEADILGRFPRK